MLQPLQISEQASNQGGSPSGPPLGLLADQSREDLKTWCADGGQPAYRVKQIRGWLFRRRAESFEAMRDLPAKLRQRLAEHYHLFASDVARHQLPRDRKAKLLLRLRDGEDVECVLMRETDRVTFCISTQVGCAMGCVFCASGLLGVKRDLTSGEILEQVMRLDRLLAADERITNIVVMGMGEPLANLRNLMPALETLRADDGYGLGARRITVSTVGLSAKMRELADCGTPYNLAVSLHAPNDELRTQIVPVNANIGIDEILSAADFYFERTGRRVTYEYVLLEGVNDETTHAIQLADRLHSRNAHVNVIPMNAVDPVGLHGSSSERAGRFVDTLTSRGINATVRKRKGADIDAACGQLRLHELTASTGDTESA